MKEGYKQAESGLIPEDWHEIKIGSVCNLINGRGFKPHEWKTQGLPIIRIQNLNGSDEYNYFQGNYDKKIEIENGQLLFAWSGSRGTSFGPHIWHGSLGLLNYHTWKIIIDEKKVNKDFFSYALRHLTKYIEDKAHGASALVHTQKWEMEGYLLLIPPTITEQIAIAKVLSDTDLLIQSLEKLVRKKRAIYQGAMQELLKPKEGWVVKSLGDLAEIKDGTHQTPKYVDSGVPFYSVENVTRNDFKNTKFISEEEHKFLTKTSRIESGDILMTRIGSIGVCKLVDWDVDASFYVSLALLKVKNGFSAPYLSFYSNSFYFKKEIELNSLQSAIPKKINLGQISNVKVEIPESFEEQTRIANILSDMGKEIIALETKLVKYKQVKLGMMQNLLTGRIRLV